MSREQSDERSEERSCCMHLTPDAVLHIMVTWRPLVCYDVSFTWMVNPSYRRVSFLGKDLTNRCYPWKGEHNQTRWRLILLSHYFQVSLRSEFPHTYQTTDPIKDGIIANLHRKVSNLWFSPLKERAICGREHAGFEPASIFLVPVYLWRPCWH